MITSNTLSPAKKRPGRLRLFVKSDPFLPSLPRFRSETLPWQEPFSLFKKYSAADPLVFLDGEFSKGPLRRSLLGFHPWLWVKALRRELLVRSSPQEDWVSLESENPYQLFCDIFRSYRASQSWPEYAGAYGIFHYETGEFFERLPKSLEADSQDYFEFIFPSEIFVFDHDQHTVTVTRSDSRRESLGLVTVTRSDSHQTKDCRSQKASNLRSQFKKCEFETIVTRAKEYIRAGDIYQANLSQDFTFDYKGDAVELYERLRETNPAPFAGFLRLGGKTILSSSPELLLQTSGGRCLTRPIAGTRPRGRDSKEDRLMSRELLLSPKERAEHLMLLDLERNDLGRVAKFGTVRVEEQMVLEHYAKVIHIVSQVAAEMREDRDAFHLIEALFPGGTITGCPKIRSMEIIHELESKAREVYTGSLGFLSFSGEAVFNILIRTIALQNGAGSLRVGAGIVADSQSAREYEETLHKGRALFEALGLK